MDFITAVISYSNNTEVDIPCMLRRCALKIAKCQIDAECRQCSDCMKNCDPKDALCSSLCFFKYATKPFNQLVSCAVKAKCLPPLTWSNLTCPAYVPRRKSLTFDVTKFAELKSMVVARGSHPIYDCFPCQHLEFNALADGSVATHWSTNLDGTIRGADYQLHQETANTIVTKYQLFGMPVEEHYYILDFTPSYDYVFYFYCGFGFDGEYQGSLIYTTHEGGVLPVEVEAQFQTTLDNTAELQPYLPPLTQFCSPKYSDGC